MRKGRVRLLAAGIAVCAGVVASACGGPATPGVASLSGNTGNASHTTGSTGSGGGGSKQKAAVNFAKCMRAHGVKNFPEGPGPIKITPGSGLDPNSPTFQSAQKACGSLLPKPSAAQVNRIKQQALKYAECMRAHGVKNFPDPKVSSTGGGIGIDIGIGSGIDPNSPAFQSAQNVCSKKTGFPAPKGSGGKNESIHGAQAP